MEELVPKKKYRKGMTKALIENAKAPNPLSYVELAALLHCRPATLYARASKLRAAGRLPPRGALTFEQAAPESSTSFLDTPPSQWDEGVLAQIDKLPVLNSDQRKKLLSAIAMRPSAGVGQAAALKTLEDIDRGAGTQIGPPPPLTEQQQIERLSRLMRAVGQSVVDKSKEAAFGPNSPSKTVNAYQEGPSPDGPSHMG